jgi:hypothetical protein
MQDDGDYVDDDGGDACIYDVTFAALMAMMMMTMAATPWSMTSRWRE